MNSEQVRIEIKKEIKNGVDKLVTGTGVTVDEKGVTVDEYGSEIKSQLGHKGLTVMQNDEKNLVVDNQGVVARKLHAITYINVCERSRFEKYGSDEIACFWVGG